MAVVCVHQTERAAALRPSLLGFGQATTVVTALCRISAVRAPIDASPRKHAVGMVPVTIKGDAIATVRTQ